MDPAYETIPVTSQQHLIMLWQETTIEYINERATTSNDYLDLYYNDLIWSKMEARMTSEQVKMAQLQFESELESIFYLTLSSFANLHQQVLGPPSCSWSNSII